MTIYPDEEEVLRKEFETSSKYDTDYALERHLHCQYPLEKPGFHGCCKKSGWWVYVPNKTTPYPYGHLLHHCRKHCNTKVQFACDLCLLLKFFICDAVLDYCFDFFLLISDGLNLYLQLIRVTPGPMKNDTYTAFITTRPIKKGEELLWDYGAKCQKVVVNHF